MAISSISYSNRAFSIALSWPAGVRGTVLYALPRGAARPEDGEILAARDDPALLERYNGFCYRAGTASRIQFSAEGPGLAARWIDVYYCDFDRDGFAVAHVCAGSFFNGDCRVGFAIRYTPVGAGCRAVRIAVKNLSRFEIEPGGIGYAVGRRVFAIPVALRPGRQLELPQFEIPADAVVRMHRFEERYPARFVPLEA
ncbi:MAG: hypothetical protein ACI4MF_05720 [Candidatus Faecivicinus sp.]